MLTNL